MIALFLFNPPSAEQWSHADPFILPGGKQFVVHLVFLLSVLFPFTFGFVSDPKPLNLKNAWPLLPPGF